MRCRRRGRKRRRSAARIKLGVNWVRKDVHLGCLFPAFLQNEVLSLQIFFAVFNGNVEVAVAMRWCWLEAACGWTACSAWAGRETWCWWRRRVEVSDMVHVSIVVHHHFWCWHRKSQLRSAVWCHDSLRCEVASLHLWLWLPILWSCAPSWWVGHHLLVVHWLFLRHWCEQSVVSVFGIRTILVELNLRMSHLVVILHYASKLRPK